MFRRSILEMSSRRALNRIPRCVASQQMPSFLLSRKGFSTSSPKYPLPKGGGSGKPEEPKSGVSRVIMGGALLAGAGAGVVAYQLGYLDRFVGNEQQKVEGDVDPSEVKETRDLEKQAPTTITEVPRLSDTVEQDVQKLHNLVDPTHIEAEQKVESQTGLSHLQEEQKVETPSDFPHFTASEPKVKSNADISPLEADQRIESQADLPHSGAQGESLSNVQEIKGEKEDSMISVEEKRNVKSSQRKNSFGGLGTESPGLKTGGDAEALQVGQTQTQVNEIARETETKIVPSQHVIMEEKSEAATRKGVDTTGLLEAYHLRENVDESSIVGSGEQALDNAIEELDGGYVTKDGKLIMDFLQAIHAAEKRQAELDNRIYAEQKRLLKEKYEKELKDSRARELMRAEEAAMLDKEIKRERAKAAAAIRTIQEKMEEKLRVELEQKEKETEMELKKIQELAKAELAATIASEKASQIEKMADADLHINALCMAFYARSEEARQIHSVHKLALGALALEDALSKGEPVQKELDALNTYLDGIDKDSLLHLVLSTLPEETRCNGTDTLLQLNQRFNALKGTLRQYILIPPGGGGVLAHALSQMASWLRFKETDPSGDGIESVITRVETFLAEGKLAEAAEALQEGVRGSKAEEVADDWVTRARNRAITEQALTVLQSYATSISLTQ